MVVSSDCGEIVSSQLSRLQAEIRALRAEREHLKQQLAQAQVVRDVATQHSHTAIAIFDSHLTCLFTNAQWSQLRDKPVNAQHDSLYWQCLESGAALTGTDGSAQRWNIQRWQIDEHAGIVHTIHTSREQSQADAQRDMLTGVLRAVANHIDDLVVSVVDHDYRFVLVEGSGIESAGLQRERVLGQHISDVLAPATAAKVIAGYQATFRGDTQHVEYIGRDNHRTFDVMRAPIYDATGNITGAVGISQETTARRSAADALATSEQRYQTIVNDQSELVCRFDSDGWLTFYNKSFAHFFEISPETTLVASLAELFQPLDAAECLLHAVEQLTPTQPLGRTICRFNLHSHASVIRWTTRAIFDAADQLIEYQAVGTDITEHKRLEVILRKKRAWAETLRDVSALLNSTLELDEVLERILASISKVVAHDAANIMVLEADHATIVHATIGTSHSDDTTTIALRDAPYLAQMTHKREPLAIPHTADTQPSWFQKGAWQWAASYAGAPIVLQDDVIGFINIFSGSAGRFQERHALRLQSFADNAATALRNAQLHAHAQEIAVWEERRRIASDLHDAVSQTLFAANLIAEGLPTLWNSRPYAVPKKLQRLRQLSHIALTEMRTLLYELRPEALDQTSLRQLLEQLVAALQNRTTVRISTRYHVPHAVEVLPTDVKIACYRIAQEALNNAIRHANATQVHLLLRLSAAEVNLQVKDNGAGFDVTARTAQLGLKIMQERAQKIGATLTIQSAIGYGTHIMALWQSEEARAS